MSVAANQRPAIEQVYDDSAGESTLAPIIRDAATHSLQFFCDGQPVRFAGVSEPIGINSRLRGAPGSTERSRIQPTRPTPLFVAIFFPGVQNSVRPEDIAALERCHGCVLVRETGTPERIIERLELNGIEKQAHVWQARLRASGVTATYVAC